MGFILWIVVLIATSLGTVLAEFIVDINLIGVPEIINAIIWFLIAFATYFAGRRIEGEAWYKLVSLNFVITWAFCTVGYLLGQVVWILLKTGTVSINLQQMGDFFFLALPWTIGPTATASLGIRASD